MVSGWNFVNIANYINDGRLTSCLILSFFIEHHVGFIFEESLFCRV